MINDKESEIKSKNAKNGKWDLLGGQTRPYGNKELKTKNENMRNENRVEGQTWPCT